MPITHFCTHLNCTLPLCTKCLDQHLDQNGHSSNVRLIDQARSVALAELAAKIASSEDSLSARSLMLQKVRVWLENELLKLEKDISVQQTQLSKAKNALKRIQSGSLKNLIQQFDGTLQVPSITPPATLCAQISKSINSLAVKNEPFIDGSPGVLSAQNIKRIAFNSSYQHLSETRMPKSQTLIKEHGHIDVDYLRQKYQHKSTQNQVGLQPTPPKSRKGSLGDLMRPTESLLLRYSPMKSCDRDKFSAGKQNLPSRRHLVQL